MLLHVRLLWLCCAVLFALSAAPAAAAEAGACCPEHGFRAVLPDGWVRVPQSVIRKFSDTVHELNPDVPRQRYEYAFQPEAQGRWFSYPYILVQVLETGRVEAERLQALPKLPQQVGEHLASGFSSLLSELEFGSAVYDENARIVWSKSASRLADIGEIVVLSGSVLTSEGAIVVHCYAERSGYDSQGRSFESYIRSIRLAPGLQY